MRARAPWRVGAGLEHVAAADRSIAHHARLVGGGGAVFDLAGTPCGGDTAGGSRPFVSRIPARTSARFQGRRRAWAALRCIHAGLASVRPRRPLGLRTAAPGLGAGRSPRSTIRCGVCGLLGASPNNGTRAALTRNNSDRIQTCRAATTTGFLADACRGSRSAKCGLPLFERPASVSDLAPGSQARPAIACPCRIAASRALASHLGSGALILAAIVAIVCIADLRHRASLLPDRGRHSAAADAVTGYRNDDVVWLEITL
jgi:hypothetical protein